jgi:DNA-binding NtrC family response regulator
MYRGFKGELSMCKGFLVIEPDSSERRPLQDLFSNDYVLTFADNAAQALEIMAAMQFPVVVFNMERAGSGPIGELNALKTQMCNNSMIIAVTTYNDLETEKAIAAIGVFYHLLKPYAEKDLRDLIDAAFRELDRKYMLSSNSGNNNE